MARRTTRNRVSGALGCERGQALVEAAIAIPVLLILVFGVVAVGRVVQAKIAVQAAAREAGRTLAVAPSEHDGVTKALEAARAVASSCRLAMISDVNRTFLLILCTATILLMRYRLC